MKESNAPAVGRTPFQKWLDKYQGLFYLIPGAPVAQTADAPFFIRDVLQISDKNVSDLFQTCSEIP